MQACPYCSEAIQPTAAKCRYCGEWLDPTRRPPWSEDLERLVDLLVERVAAKLDHRVPADDGIHPQEQPRRSVTAPPAPFESVPGILGERRRSVTHPGFAGPADEAGNTAVALHRSELEPATVAPHEPSIPATSTVAPAPAQPEELPPRSRSVTQDIHTPTPGGPIPGDGKTLRGLPVGSDDFPLDPSGLSGFPVDDDDDDDEAILPASDPIVPEPSPGETARVPAPASLGAEAVPSLPPQGEMHEQLGGAPPRGRASMGGGEASGAHALPPTADPRAPRFSADGSSVAGEIGAGRGGGGEVVGPTLQPLDPDAPARPRERSFTREILGDEFANQTETLHETGTDFPVPGRSAVPAWAWVIGVAALGAAGAFAAGLIP